ncbi:aspartate aminotransferase family protein [Cellulomonas cellasea]|uniref:class-III pyridoxal-phosphate-dependent aminotransferase n=1 Tax=Cellulomonas cellasea TaxID=43670 RepID=UPI0025A36CEB|nr:aspartate aminotransferase family protein [Cellulomonas cellasea]MDM8085347.1 aspartate aminotransferase family protein [Cellulomonas cellasea]
MAAMQAPTAASLTSLRAEAPITSRIPLSGLPVEVPDVVGASGCVLRTVDGRELIDFESGVWCANLGHGHPAVTAALVKQAVAVTHVGYRWAHPVIAEAHARLCEVTGLADGRAVLLASGSEAVELGIRIASSVTGRDAVLRFSGHYLSAYGAAGAPGTGRQVTVEELDAMDSRQRRDALARIAAVVLEPGNASGLVRLPDAERVARVVDEVRAAGGLLVVDEVTTGFGRTGRWFGFQHVGVRPDIVAVGKGAGNGYPVSAVVVAREVADRTTRAGLRYAQSHQDDPLGAAVLLAVIEAIEAEGLLSAAVARGAQLTSGLAALAASGLGVRAVRGRGLMCAFDVASGAAARTQSSLLDHGYLVGAHLARDTIRVYPPLVVTPAQIEGFLAAARATLSAVG